VKSLQTTDANSSPGPLVQVN